MPVQPGGQIGRPAANGPTHSQLFPFLSKGGDLASKAFLWPVIVTTIAVILMFGTYEWPAGFRWVLAVYLSLAMYYFLYRLCGKSKPAWLLLLVAVVTPLLMVSPVFDLFVLIFRKILPGQMPPRRLWSTLSFPVMFFKMFFAAGLMEELLKALPVFALVGIGAAIKGPWREKIGVIEPLDGILIGAASATGFVLAETMGQYVPDAMSMDGKEAGLQILIPRVLGQITGHVAYSGYFGYFIGLAAIQRSVEDKLKALGIGLLCAATFHALWNSTPLIGLGAQFLVAAGSYAFLAAAILKARQISPTRSRNFATTALSSPLIPIPQAQRPAPPPPPPPPVMPPPPIVPKPPPPPVVAQTPVPPKPPAPPEPPAPKPASGPPLPVLRLVIGDQMIPVVVGRKLVESDVPGLHSQDSSGVVAEVNQNPKDPTVFGLKNLSTSVWTVHVPDGSVRSIQAGQSIRLSPGTGLNFGPVRADVK